MKQFCMKIDLISQERENVLFLPSNMAAMMSHENALLKLRFKTIIFTGKVKSFTHQMSSPQEFPWGLFTQHCLCTIFPQVEGGV